MLCPKNSRNGLLPVPGVRPPFPHQTVLELPASPCGLPVKPVCRPSDGQESAIGDYRRRFGGSSTGRDPQPLSGGTRPPNRDYRTEAVFGQGAGYAAQRRVFGQRSGCTARGRSSARGPAAPLRGGLRPKGRRSAARRRRRAESNRTPKGEPLLSSGVENRPGLGPALLPESKR